MVVLQRSFGGKEYPVQPKNTPVLAVLIANTIQEIDTFTKKLKEILGETHGL